MSGGRDCRVAIGRTQSLQSAESPAVATAGGRRAVSRHVLRLVLTLGTIVLGSGTANAEPMTRAEQGAYERQIALCNRTAQAVYASTVYLIQYRVAPDDFVGAMKEWSIPEEDKAEMANAYRWVYERQPTNPVAASKIRVAECMGERWHRAPGEDPVYQYHQEGPY